MSVANRVMVFEDTLSVELGDGRTIAAPLAWYPRLLHATPKERREWRLIANGRGIHWRNRSRGKKGDRHIFPVN
jgi:hypothetical protein